MQGWLLTCLDVVASEAVYQAACHRSFCQVKGSDIELCRSAGRPEDSDKCYSLLCTHLEAADEQLYAVSDLHTDSTGHR